MRINTVKEKRVTCCYRGLFLVLLFLMAGSVYQVSAQSTCNASSVILVGATDFECTYDYGVGQTHHELQHTAFYGPSGATMSTPCTFTTNPAQVGRTVGGVRYYGVVKNPADLGQGFPSINKSMIVMPWGGSAQNMLRFDVAGLNPNSPLRVKIEGYYLTAHSCGTATNFMLAFNIIPSSVPNGIQMNPNTATNINFSSVAGVANKFEGTYTAALTGNATFAEMTIRGSYHPNSCGIVGISKIEVYGCPNIGVLSLESDEMCLGEQTRLSLDRNYATSNLRWEKSTNGTTFNEVLGTSGMASIIEEITQDTWYRCVVSGVTSKALAIKTITCCVNSDGFPTSRKVVYHETFGVFNGPRDYVDAWGVPQPTLVENDFCARLPAVPGAPTGVQGHSVECPVANMGRYSISPYAGLSVTYMRGCIQSDAENNIRGAMLSLDVARNMTGVIYERLITGLCSGKKIYFQIAYAPGRSGSGNARIEASVTKTDGSPLNVPNPRTILTNKRQNGGFGCGWNLIKTDPFILPEGETSVYLQLCSYGTDWQNNEDLNFDDIKFMVCSPPNVEAYSDLEKVKQDTTICGPTMLEIATKLSKLAEDTYGGAANVRFIFQWSSDNKNWNNIGNGTAAIRTTSSVTINSEDYPYPRTYFRLAVATEGALMEYVNDPNYESFEDNCRNTSVSKPFSLFKENTLNGMEEVQLQACKGETVTLNGVPAATEPKITQWEWVGEAGNVLVPKTSTGSRNYNYTFSGSGSSAVVYFVAYTSNCSARKKFTISEKPTVTFTLSQQQNCGNTVVTATSVPASGVTYAWTYTGGAAITATGPSVTLNNPAYTNGTITATGKAAGYCDSNPVSQAVTINTIPPKPTVAKTVVSYQMEAGSVDISSDVGASALAGNSIVWRNAGESSTAPGTVVAPPMQNKATEGTYYFWVVQVTPQGCRDSIQVTVIISEVPTPQVNGVTVCQNKSVGDLSPLVVSNTEAGYELVWYTSLTGAGLPTPPDPATISTATVGTHDVAYVTYREIADNNKESGKVPIKVTVLAPATATIGYGITPFCTSETTPQPVSRTGTGNYTTGTYSAPNGLEIDPATGAITPSQSNPGTYLVTYTIPADLYCDAVTTDTEVTITRLPSATIAYAGTPFCSSLDAPQAVTLTPGAGEYSGGTYSADAGIDLIALNALNGDITPSGSKPGIYEVTYTIPAFAGCEAVPVKTSVVINQAPDATISYASPFCTSDGIKLVIFDGTEGGTYSANSDDIALNALNGAITPTQSKAGTYTITYTIEEAGGCGEFTTETTVVITQAPSAEIEYAKASFCKSDVIQQVKLDGEGDYQGGVFSATPDGLIIDANTGAITPETSKAGTYTVKYSLDIPGSECDPVTAIAEVTIVALPEAKILTAAKSICPNETVELSSTVANGTIQWSGGGGTFSNPTSAVTIYTPGVSDAGNTVKLTLTVTGYDACSSETATDDYNLTVIPFPEMPVVNENVIYFRSDLQSDNKFKNLLAHNPNAVTSSANATLLWWYDGDWRTTPPTPPTPAADVFKDWSETYTIKQKLNTPPTCESQTATVTVYVYLTATPTVAPVSYCIDDASTPLSAKINPAEDYIESDYILIWYDKDGNVENNAPVPSTALAGETVYYVSQFNTKTQAESGRAPLRVTVYGVKQPDVSGNKLTYCAYDTPVDLVVNKVEAPYYPADGFKWSVNGSPQPAKPSVNTDVSTNTTYRYGVKQTYLIPGTDKTCEGEEVTFEVYITEKFRLELAAVPEKVQVGNEATLTVTASTDNHRDYEWYDNNALFRVTGKSENVIKEAFAAGIHRFQVKTSNDECFAESNTKEIEVADFTIIPNIISPYSEINNTFMVSKSPLAAGYKVEVYNRYKQKVYEGDNGWDGTYRGAIAEPGTYFYRVFMKDGRIEVGTLEVVKF